VLRTVGAVVALALVTAACGGNGERVIPIAGERVPVARLVDAHAALCEAVARPAEARALFFDRAHESLHTVARALELIERDQAAALLVAKEKVEAELGGGAGDLPQDLSTLADVYRTSLRRLAIAAPPCDK
jgi:hypothetical protein